MRRSISALYRLVATIAVVRYLTLAALTAALASAQWSALIDVYGSFYNRAPAMAVGPGGDIWVGGGNGVARISREGNVLWTARLPISIVSALAVNQQGHAFAAGWMENENALVELTTSGDVRAVFPLTGQPWAMTIDGTGALYIAGTAGESFRTTPGAYKTDIGEKRCSRRGTPNFACADAFALKLRPGSGIEWATLLGGTWNDHARAIAVDEDNGTVWIAGEAMSNDFPVTSIERFGGIVTLGPLEYGDGFVAALDSRGSRLLYSTYLGGSGVDYVNAIAMTSAGVVVTGATQSINFPITSNAHQAAFSGNPEAMPNSSLDAFVVHLSRSGERLYSSYFGQAHSQENGTSVAVASPTDIAVAVSGRSGSCILRYTPGNPRLREDCYQVIARNPLGIAHVNGQWIGAGHTLAGLEVPGAIPAPRLAVSPLDGIGDNTGPAVVGLWNEYLPIRRPLVAAGSVISIYHAGVGSAGLENTVVQLGSRRLPVLYAGINQVNAVVPADVSIGFHSLTVSMPFFSTVPVAVDVVPRWPGLYSGALNQDGSVNSEANPALRGEIVSLFGNGFGPEPLPVVETWIAGQTPGSAQGMQVLYAGRAPNAVEGVYQVNARIPSNAQTGRVPVRVTMRLENGFVQSPLGYIWVQ